MLSFQIGSKILMMKRYGRYSMFSTTIFKQISSNSNSKFRLPIAQDCHEMWSKEHRRLTRRGWSENQIQAHFKEREVFEYQRYNHGNGNRISSFVFLILIIFFSSDMQMDSPEPISERYVN